METFDRQYFLSSRRRKSNVSLLADWRIFPIWQLLVPATQDLLGLFHSWSFTVYNTFSPVVQQWHYIELCHFKMVQCVPNKMVLSKMQLLGAFKASFVTYHTTCYTYIG